MERSDFDDLDRALSTNADLVAECVRQLDAAVGQEAVAAVYRSLVRKYGEQAAAVAVEFYRAQRDAAVPEEEYEAQVYAPENSALLEWDVRDAYSRSRDESSIARILAGRAQQRVMAYADETFAANAYRDPARPYFAIVPHPGACGWCVMLGSNGFMFSTAATANAARHAHCKCTPCVEFGDDPHLDGYNPKAMQDSYRSCRETVEDDARRKWAGMSGEERAKYTRADRNGNRRVSYDAYLRNRIANEMSARDRDWLQGSSAYSRSYGIIAGAEPSAEEKSTAGRLLDAGIVPTFRPTRDIEMLRTSDVYISRGTSQEEWDFKSPKGNGRQTLYHQFEEAAGQAHKIVIDLARTVSGGIYDDGDFALGMVERFIRYHYTVERGVNSGDSWLFDEALLILKDGAIKRITR